MLKMSILCKLKALSVWFGGSSTADCFLECVLKLDCDLKDYHACVGTLCGVALPLVSLHNSSYNFVQDT